MFGKEEEEEPKKRRNIAKEEAELDSWLQAMIDNQEQMYLNLHYKASVAEPDTVLNNNLTKAKIKYMSVSSHTTYPKIFYRPWGILFSFCCASTF